MNRLSPSDAAIVTLTETSEIDLEKHRSESHAISIEIKREISQSGYENPGRNQNYRQRNLKFHKFESPIQNHLISKED